MSSSLERYLVKNALIDFQLALHSSIPLRRYSEFYTQLRMKEAIRQERRKLLTEFMTKIADLSSERISVLVKEINDGMDETISEYLAKNEEHRKWSKSFLNQTLEFLCEEYQCSVNTHLKHDPFMELESLQTLLGSEVEMVKGRMQNWLVGFGPDDFKAMHQNNLRARLEMLQTDILKKHKIILKGSAKEEETRFEEMRVKVAQCLDSEEFAGSGAVQEKGAGKLEEIKSCLQTSEIFSRIEHRRIHDKLLEKLIEVEEDLELDRIEKFARNLKCSHLLDCFIDRDPEDRNYVGLQVRKLYDKEINRCLENVDILTLDQLEQVHSQTIKTLIEETGMIMNPTTGKTIEGDAHGWILNLESGLNIAFVNFKKQAEGLIEKRKKEKMERQQHEKNLELLNECLPIANTQVKQMVPTFSNYWISINDFNPRTIFKFKNVFDHCLGEILGHNYRNVIAPYLWNDFHHQVQAGCYEECMSFLSIAFEPVCKFSQEIGRQLDLYAYFPPEKFAEIASQAGAACLTEEMKKNNLTYEITCLAMKRILDYYTATNAAVMESEENLRETVRLQMKNFYNDEMKGYLKKHGPFTRNQFEQIHSELLRRLINWSKKIVNPTTGNILPEDAQKWIPKLENELSEIFGGYKDANEMKFKRLLSEVNKLESRRYEEYVRKMEDVLQRNPLGYEPGKLNKVNQDFLNEQKILLKIDIKKTIRECEPTDGYCENLTHRILKHWSKVNAANETNLATTLCKIRMDSESNNEK